jgi:GTP diphosphokinase / guanosine-3',5'-bis(diphosphate) 3'-diphosphatase
MPESLIYFEESESLVIQRAYRLLLKSIKTPVTPEDSKNIRRAYEMAVDAHSQQRRKSGEPYILHPIEVARICAEEIGLGPTAVVAALLHDVVEDTDVTLGEIETQFGKKIATIVDGLTKLDANDNSESPQAENFKKILGTLVDDVRIVLIKMADRLHNMRTLGSMPQHKQLKIAAETEFIYAPLAHRLGLYNFRSEFLDLCLKITHREEYDDIAHKLNETKRERNTYIDEFIKPLIMFLEEIGVPYRVSGRPKSIYSIWNKLKTKHCAFEDIFDLFAVRIIMDVPPEREKALCWQVYSIVTSVHTPIPERLKDWITIPKSNGYESLHTTVIGPDGRYVEVQIRSERMDEVAERGYAAHWKYKGVRNQQDVFEAWLNSVREMVEKANNDSSIDFIQDFKTTNLFTEEIYVYTPKGDLKILPKGATALDFAFNIHSDVGYHCQAVKVNNRLVPMGYKLQNGDQVSVVTNRSQRPGEDWLKWVVTSKARDKIRMSLKEEQRQQAIFGKEALQRKLEHLKVDFDTSVELLSKHFNFRARQEFYAAIANDTVDLQDDLKVFKVEKGKLLLIEDEKEPPLSNESRHAQNAHNAEKRAAAKPEMKANLLINGESANLYKYHLADCCKPVQGDDVFAYVSANNVMNIHRTGCNNAKNLMSLYGYRIHKAEWGSTANSSFVAELLITGIDNGPGVIERLSNKISSQIGLNIRSFSIEGNEGYFEGRVKVVVSNKDQLALAIKALKGLEGVSNVIRVE